MNALLVRFFAMAAIVAPTIADAAELLPAYTFPDGSAGFEFRTSGGITNPGVLVGFNPQPDPPGVPTATADLRDPTSPVFDQTSQATDLSSDGLAAASGHAEFASARRRYPAAGTGSPGSLATAVLTQACDGSVFQISLAFPADDVTSWSSVNPQPDPPGLYFRYLATFSGEPTFALSIMDGGNPLTFSPVPEPATWGLMAVGFVSLGAFAMRRRAKAEAA